MSTLSEKKYLEHLKLIKEAEDKVQIEIEGHRKLIEEEIKHLQEEYESSIVAHRLEGEKIIEKSIHEARDTATKEAETILTNAENRSKTISFKAEPQIIKHILDILLSEMK
jgi:V/A-type H+/Na+-transporting ATPase subunit G/H